MVPQLSLIVPTFRSTGYRTGPLLSRVFHTGTIFCWDKCLGWSQYKDCFWYYWIENMGTWGVCLLFYGLSIVCDHLPKCSILVILCRNLSSSVLLSQSLLNSHLANMNLQLTLDKWLSMFAFLGQFIYAYIEKYEMLK
jgi:hypothetical protein